MFSPVFVSTLNINYPPGPLIVTVREVPRGRSKRTSVVARALPRPLAFESLISLSTACQEVGGPVFQREWVLNPAS